MQSFSAGPTGITPFVYGTTRLGDEKMAFEERVKIARSAIDAGLWLHTSDQYGEALSVLKEAIAQSDASPSMIFKIGWESVDQIREQVVRQLEAAGMERMAVGQLCLNGALAEAFQHGDASALELNKLKEEGLVGQFVLELWPWNSQVAIDALKGGHAHELLDGFIFYLNPMQRFVLNQLWDLIAEHGVPVVAMRTVAGGSVLRARDVPGAAPEYLQKRAVQLAPIFESSGCENWTEFCVRFSFGMPGVLATVGSTNKPANLAEFLSAAEKPVPLPVETVAAILELHRSWSEDHDRFAKPWSM